MRNLLHCSVWKSAVLLGILLAATRVASAQALLTAQRGTEIAPFAQFTLVGPDWGQSNNFGYTAGIDYTHFIRSSIVQPSLEFRYTSANGLTVNERSYAGGLRLQTTVHGIHPYATFLVGHGNIDFNYLLANNNYHGDNSFIYCLGGGAEFNVTPVWKLRLDLSSQQWNTGSETLSPLTIGVGMAYSLPSHIRRVE
jgi:opacity protein-like surface antigen